MMNRLRTRKKAKEASVAQLRPSNESEAPSLPSLGGKSSKKNKNKQPEPKPEIDIAHALPSTDDFRTSLLMPNLSARFSMLREQDDPNTKIGKANDDSVLFPKRTSRYGDFGQPSPALRSPTAQGSNLADIMEVSSIRGSIRRPFAERNSFGSGEGYGTDGDSSHSGSVMSRPKPGEGNNLFGGRQKIYKISTGTSGSTSGNESAGRAMGGKFLYENDVATSSFQRLRETERERERELERRREEAEAQQRLDFLQRDRANSPPLPNYNTNRETSSSTTSGPSNTRTSTAATSITSQGTPSMNGGTGWGSPPALPASNTATMQNGSNVERSTTKSRRLYEQGLDQHLHDQQSFAMNRLDILSRQRTVNGGTPPGTSASLVHANSTSNLNERFDQPTPVVKSTSLKMRAASPPPAPATNGFRTRNFSESEPKVGSGSPNIPQSRSHSPTISRKGSNDISDAYPAIAKQPEEENVAAVALNAFARQKRQYDDQQYSQRQVQMQQGRESPFSARSSPPRTSPPQYPAPNPPLTTRMRADSNATSRSRSNSSVRRQYPQPVDSPPKKPIPFNPPNLIQRPKFQDAAQLNGTFLDVSSSDAEGPPTLAHYPSKPGRRPDGRHNQFFPPQAPQVPLEEHPALRPQNRPEPQQELYHEISYDAVATSNLKSDDVKGPLPDNVKSSDEEETDSPTLGPPGGLSGLVRRHLRSDSGLSSVYGGGLSSYYGTSTSNTNANSNYSRPGLATQAYDKNLSARGSRMTEQSAESSGNPWEFEDWDGGYFGEAESNSSIGSPVGPSLTNGSTPQPLTVSTKPPQQSGQQTRTSDPTKEETEWEDQTKARHVSNVSTETQKERDEFANELAQRKKKIQDNLKVYAESRSASPAPVGPSTTPGSEHPKESPVKNGTPFGFLNPKSSRTSLNGRSEGSSKAMKMFGLGVANGNSPRIEEDYWKKEEDRLLRETVKIPKAPSAPMISHVNGVTDLGPSPRSSPANRQGPFRAEETRQNGEDYNKTSSRPSRPPSSNRSSGRDRSGSDNSGGPRNNRDRTYRDDLQRAMARGTGSTANLLDDVPQGRKYSDPTRPNPEAFQQAPPSGSTPVIGSSNRSRSNSRSMFPGALDHSKMMMPPIQTNGMSQPLGMSPRPSPSPMTPYSANSTPSLYDPPAVSTATTPTKNVNQGFQSSGRIPPNRKRSVNKADISEPTFLSATSTITTINLPPGASLKNGIEPPPVPPINPRRRRITTTHTMFSAFSRSDKTETQPPMPAVEVASTEERSTFSADEGESRPKHKGKLRKSSSEGGSMNARARQQAMMAPSPAMPTFPPGAQMMAPSPAVPIFPHSRNSPPTPAVVEGGMF